MRFMISMRDIHRGCLVFFLLFFTSQGLALGATGSLEERLAKLEESSAAAKVSTGDNAWMLASSALVLMMTAPGLILFYGGLVRRKNVLATMMHSLVLMAVMSVLWVVYGYSVAFSDGSPFFGGSGYLFLQGVGTAPNTDYAATIP